MQERKYGIKFIAEGHSTREYLMDSRFGYPAPPLSDEWSPWMFHPRAVPGMSGIGGPNRIHLMRGLDSRYAYFPTWPWIADYREYIDGDDVKFSAGGVRLKRITTDSLSKIIQNGSYKSSGSYNLSFMVLKHMELSDVCFFNFQFDEGHMINSDFNNASLVGSSFRLSFIKGVTFRGASLAHSYLDHSVFENCTFNGSNLNGVWARRTVFIGCRFVETDWGDSHFENATFVKCGRMGHVDLEIPKSQGATIC